MGTIEVVLIALFLISLTSYLFYAMYAKSFLAESALALKCIKTRNNLKILSLITFILLLANTIRMLF